MSDTTASPAGGTADTADTADTARAEQPVDGATARDTPQRRAEAHDGHGHSTATWTAVGIVMLGSLIASIAVVRTTWWLLIVGLVIACLGGVVGKVMHQMGFGEKPYDRDATDTRHETR